jgi:type IV secretory pathway VirB2 component (pilin)
MKKLMNSNKAKFFATFLTSSVLAFAQSSPLENVVNAGEAMTIRLVTPIATTMFLFGVLRAGLNWIRGGVALMGTIFAIWLMLRPDQVIGWLRSFGS